MDGYVDTERRERGRERERVDIVVSDEHTPVGSDIAAENKVALGDTASLSIAVGR